MQGSQYRRYCQSIKGAFNFKSSGVLSTTPTMSVPGEPDQIQQTMEEGTGRYAVYANRLRTAILSGLRYSAYSSELGEAFRPLTKPIFVRTAYGVSWTYVIGDVGYAGYKAREQHRALTAEGRDPTLKVKRLAEEAKEATEKAAREAKQAAEVAAAKAKEGKVGDVKAAVTPPSSSHESQHHHGGSKIDPLELGENGYIALVATRRAVLQSIISMLLPAVVVHQSVHYSAPVFGKYFKNHKVKAFGPTLLGLSLIPFFPALFDEPGEKIIDGVFDYAESLYFQKKQDADPSTAKASAAMLAFGGTASTMAGVRKQLRLRMPQMTPAVSSHFLKVAARPNAWTAGGFMLFGSAFAMTQSSASRSVDVDASGVAASS
ncbi:unnamed protein product [Jaminaea pallidilutea]